MRDNEHERASVYRKVEVRMWSDAKFMGLTPMLPSGQALWLFLLTGPYTGPIPGVFRAGRASLAEALGWEQEAFDKAFKEAFDQGMVEADWKARLVWIPNAIKSNRPASPNVVISWANEWELLPECTMKSEVFDHLKACIHALGEAFGKAFDKAIRKPFAKTMANQEQEQEQKQEENITSAKPAAAAPPVSNSNPHPPQQPKDRRKTQRSSEEDWVCAKWIYDRILANNPDHKAPNLQAWADEVRLIRERDGRGHREICELFGWAQDDGFWRANVLSPAKLREKWDQLTMQRARPKAGGAGAWWLTDEAMNAKAAEFGLTANRGEGRDQFKARIQAAIDKPKRPPADPDPAPAPAPVPPPHPPAPAARSIKPEGLDLKSLVKPAPPKRSA